MDTPLSMERALKAAGELLARRGQVAGVVVVGGTALNLLGVVTRVTRDVDVIASAAPPTDGPPQALAPADPLPEALVDVMPIVGRDLGLPADWINTVVAQGGQTELPPGFASRVTWRRYGGLWVGVAGRYDLICFKLHAAADQAERTSRHVGDLVALDPTDEELGSAAEWVRTQDPSQAMAKTLELVIVHVEQTRR